MVWRVKDTWTDLQRDNEDCLCDDPGLSLNADHSTPVLEAKLVQQKNFDETTRMVGKTSDIEFDETLDSQRASHSTSLAS